MFSHNRDFKCAACTLHSAARTFRIAVKHANSAGVHTVSKGTWVQTERAAHESWDLLIKKNPTAARLMHRIVSQMDKRGALIVSQKTLAEMIGVHRNTVGKAIRVLENDNWLETVQIGAASGGVKCYVVNRRVAWADKRENQRYAMFDARVIASADEQSEGYDSGGELKILPRAGEFQLPSGGGIEPPSQPVLPELDPDLPATGDSHLQEDLI